MSKQKKPVLKQKRNATPKPLKKKSEYQKIPGLEARMAKFIPSGELVKNSLDVLYQKILKEFGDIISKYGYYLSRKEFFRHMEQDIVWNKDRKQSLKNYIRGGLGGKGYHKDNPEITWELVAKQEKWELGVSGGISHPTAQLKGFANFTGPWEDNVKPLQLPKYGSKNPFVIATRNIPKAGNALHIINGANIGMVYNRLIVENPVRRGLADSEHFGDDAIILVNMLRMRIMKTGGPSSVLYALAEGYNSKAGILDPAYQEQAQNILSGARYDEVLYETDEEVAKNLLSAWTKIGIRGTDKKPEYSGPVYCVLGYTEEALASGIAYWRMGQITRHKQVELDVQIKTATKKLSTMESDGYDAVAIKRQKHKLGILVAERNRTMVSNIRPSEKKRYFAKALAFVAQLIETHIPNAKVVGIGTTSFKYHDKVVEVYVPSHEKVEKGLMESYTNNYGPKTLRGEFPDVAVICHPFGLHYESTDREVDKDATRKSAEVLVAPILVDDRVTREQLTHTIRKVNKISHVVLNEQFQPGSIRLVFSDNLRPQPNENRIETIGTLGKIKGNNKDNVARYIPGSYTYPKYIWIMVGTDMHLGGRTRVYIKDPRTWKRLGMVEAVFELLRRSGFAKVGARCPVHLFVSPDDGVQGNHFEGHKHLSPKELSKGLYEGHILQLREKAYKAKTLDEQRGIMDEIIDFSFDQKALAGTDFVGAQMKQVSQLILKANADMFSAILRSHTRAGLKILGMSDYEKTPGDGRDVGAIVLPSGNHGRKSTDGAITEGTLYAELLQGMLLAFPEWKNKDEIISRLVKGPVYSTETIGWGTIEAPGGYRYGLDVRGTPAGMKGWGQPLRGWAEVDPRRGNYSRIFDGKVTLKICGDKHFNAGISTPYAIYAMGPPGVHTDEYGERGFPPNGTGIIWIGLPVDGPDYPILRRTLPYDTLRDIYANNREMDWDTFLINPV